MEVINKMEGGDFTLYFLAFDDGKGLTPEEKSKTVFDREGAVCLFPLSAPPPILSSKPPTIIFFYL